MTGKITFRRLATRGAGWMQVEIEAGDQVINLRFDLEGRELQDSFVRMILGAPAVAPELTFAILDKSFDMQERKEWGK